MPWLPTVMVCVALTAWPGARQSGLNRPHTYVVAQLDPGASDSNPGTAARPFETISRATRNLAPGDAVVIENGVYREHITISASGTSTRPTVIAAAPLANVVITGADRLTTWTREPGPDNVFSADWPYEFLGWSSRRAHPDDDYHLMIGRAEQVHVDNYPLLQVLSRDKLSRGTFFVDVSAKRLYVWDRANRDLSKGECDVETSTRSDLLTCKGSYIRVRGIHFRYAANPAQHGAVSLAGSHDTLEDCVIERTNSEGVAFSADHCTIRQCTMRENGLAAFGGQGHDFLMTGCVVENNNVKGWMRGWEAVDKIVLSRNTVVEKSIFRNNRGVGLWFDIGNEDCTVRNCLFQNNEDAGLFYEISSGLHAHDNVFIGNGLAETAGAWGANGGIALSSSPNCVVERNLVIANREGFQLREQARTTPRIGDRSGKEYATWCHDETIRNNTIAYNRDVQTAGWLDVGDFSVWPRALQAAKAGHPLPAREPLPADLTHLTRKPAGLALEDLHFRFESNVYATRPGQRLYQWGPTWTRHENYATLAAVQSTLHFEAGSLVLPVTFRDWLTLDLRVPKDSPLIRLGGYPRGEVPGVKLGTY